MKIWKSGLFKRAILGAVGAGALAGGGKLYIDTQSDLNSGRLKTTALEKRIDQLTESEKAYAAKLHSQEVLAQTQEEQSNRKISALTSSFKAVTVKLNGVNVQLDEVTGKLEVANSEIKSMTDKFLATEKTLDNVSRTLLNKGDDKKIETLVEKVMPSSAMLNMQGQTWTGYIGKINGERYFITCSHSPKDKEESAYNYFSYLDFPGVTEPKLNICTLQHQVKITTPPSALKNNLIGYLSPNFGDYLMFPVPAAANKIYDKVEQVTRMKIGLEFEDFRNPPKMGETLINIGNPQGKEYSLGIRVLSGSPNDRIWKTQKDGPTRAFYQVFPGPSPGDSGSPLINERGKVVGLLIQRVDPNIGFAVNYQQMVYDLHTTFKMEGVVTDEERKTPDWKWFEEKVGAKRVFTVPQLRDLSRFSSVISSTPTNGNFPLPAILPKKVAK